MRPLRVGLNLTWIAPGRVGGSEAYLMRQLAGIADGAAVGEPRLELQVFCHAELIDAHPDLLSRVNVVTMPTKRDQRGIRIVLEHSWLSRVTRTADVVHHGGGTRPIVGHNTTVVTVHDLQYRQFPQYFHPLRRQYLQAMMPISTRRATMIATPTEYVRQTVIDAFSIAPERVIAVPHGVPAMPQPTATTIGAARTRYGIGSDYLLYPAITHPHKGHRLLVDVMAANATPASPLHGLQLVLIGGAGPAESELMTAIASAGLGDRIVRTGRVSESERNALLAGAQAMVFPSEYEGFGAPLVEAMSLDVPVVASNHPAVAEVVADAGVIVDGRTADAWTDGIANALSAPETLIAAGQRRRQAFTAQRSAVVLGDVYRRAAALRPAHADTPVGVAS